jgi:alkylation response protein AidB-like acyl-CoA dehydrogenase
MRLSWTPRQLEQARRFENLGRDLIWPHSQTHNSLVELDLAAWEAVALEGLWRLPVPVELGGDGLGWWDFCAALEGITRGACDLGFSLSLIAHAGLVRTLVLFGTDSQQRNLLPRLMGGAVGATALTEGSGGSDVARVQTLAHPDGNGYRLNGTKAHITNAPVADIFFVLGRLAGLPGKADITVFLVDREQDGVETGEAETMLGNRSSPTGGIWLRDVWLSEDAILGYPGKGLELTYWTVALDRLLYGVVSAAYLDVLLEQALEYASSRRAFGAPIADYQYVQRRITNLKITAESTRWLSYAALDKLINGDPQAQVMCSTAKLVGSEALVAGAMDAMQLFGHLGYEAGFVSRSVSDALGTLIAGGTSDMQRKNIFTQLTRPASARRREERHLEAA